MPSNKDKRPVVTLLLEDGTTYKSKSFGAVGTVVGEIIFNTSMSGYQEIISDPASAGQIITMTYPEIGNYGVNEDDFEAQKPAALGMVVKNHNPIYSHYKAEKSLGAYFKEYNLIGIENVDTRSIVKKIRENGTMVCLLTTDELDDEKREMLKNYKSNPDIVMSVTPKKPEVQGKGGKIKLALLDYGCKASIVENLATSGCEVTVYPANTPAQTILDGGHDALFLSSGPGDPVDCRAQVEAVRELTGKLPIYAVCLGAQILALALGGQTYKLKYGHHGANHPVMNKKTGKVAMALQNHGYSIEEGSLPDTVEVTHINLNDKTLEGFESASLKARAIQFYPENFDKWVSTMERGK